MSRLKLCQNLSVKYCDEPSNYTSDVRVDLGTFRGIELLPVARQRVVQIADADLVEGETEVRRLCQVLRRERVPVERHRGGLRRQRHPGRGSQLGKGVFEVLRN